MSIVSEKIAASQRRARQQRVREERERQEGAGYQVAFAVRLDHHIRNGSSFSAAQVAASNDVRELWPRASVTESEQGVQCS